MKGTHGIVSSSFLDYETDQSLFGRIAERRIYSARSLSLALSYVSFEQRQIHLKLDSSTILSDKVKNLHFSSFLSLSILVLKRNTSSVDQETIARLAEADLVTQDLERANSRVAEVERRNEKLRAEIETVRSGSESAVR